MSFSEFLLGELHGFCGLKTVLYPYCLAKKRNTTMKLHLRPIVSFWVLCVLLVIGCKKKTFKSPTTVIFDINATAEGVGGSDFLTFDNHSGYIVLENFTVLGKRTGFEDFTFSRTFPNGLHIPLNGKLTTDDLEFELPEGNYDRLTVSFETINNRGVNLFVNGVYKYRDILKGVSMVRLEWEETRTFEVDVKDALGNGELELRSEQIEKPQIVLVPKTWFKQVSELMLNNASFVSNSSTGEQIMTIDNQTNRPIFDTLDGRLGTSIHCTL